MDWENGGGGGCTEVGESTGTGGGVLRGGHRIDFVSLRFQAWSLSEQ